MCGLGLESAEEYFLFLDRKGGKEVSHEKNPGLFCCI